MALLNLLPESPERDLRELDLTQSVVRTLEVTSGYSTPETIAARARAEALAEKSGNLTQLVTWMIARGISANAGNFSAAVALADQALELALRESSPAILANLHTLQIQACYNRGDLASVEKHFAAGIKYFDDPGFRQLPGIAIVAFGFAASNAWALGRAGAARERMTQMMAAAHGSNPLEVAFSTVFAAVIHNVMREYDQAEAVAARGLELSEKIQIPQMAAFCRCALGHARAQLGRATEGIALLRQGLAVSLEIGTRIAETGFTAWLAEAQEREGAIADALDTVERALQANPDELVNRLHALRLRGELRLKQGDTELAEADFREAIALAQKMGAKTLELQATTSLARLLNKQGRRDEARTMLAEIYGWFTEGFDTADLKDAKALLDELSG